ncbi:hypothetical protein [Vibrio natriegens]|uniref:hypothetical protein n=1 Tax=Vibrio natriegens TaxID=691 RepID=UPI00390BB56F
MTKAVLQYGTAVTLSEKSEFSEYQYILALSKIKPCIKRMVGHNDGLPKNELTFGQNIASAFANLENYE